MRIKLATMINVDRFNVNQGILEVTQKNNACMAGLIRLCTNNMLSISCFSELKLFKFIWLSIEISNRDFKIPCSDLLV